MSIAGQTAAGPIPVSKTSIRGKLGAGLLTALVVGSMVGSGVFSLPQNMAAGADSKAILIGWLITGVGMICLALVYQGLAVRKPNLELGALCLRQGRFRRVYRLQ